jgi:hypothetical protein
MPIGSFQAKSPSAACGVCLAPKPHSRRGLQQRLPSQTPENAIDLTKAMRSRVTPIRQSNQASRNDLNCGRRLRRTEEKPSLESTTKCAPEWARWPRCEWKSAAHRPNIARSGALAVSGPDCRSRPQDHEIRHWPRAERRSWSFGRPGADWLVANRSESVRRPPSEEVPFCRPSCAEVSASTGAWSRHSSLDRPYSPSWSPNRCPISWWGSLTGPGTCHRPLHRR